MQEVPHAARDTVEVVEGVHLTQLAAGDRMSVQRFHIEPGAVVPQHSHPSEQVGYVASGTFTFATGEGAETLVAETDPAEDPEDAVHVIGPGDSYVVPGEEVHAAANHSAEPVSGVDVFSPPRENPDWRD